MKIRFLKTIAMILTLMIFPAVSVMAAPEGNAVASPSASAPAPAVQSQVSGDDSILKAVQEYLHGRVKMSGTLDLYDEKIKMVRNLQTIEIHKDIAAASDGKVVSIDYRDINNGDIVTVEVPVREEEGVLKVGDPVINGIKPLKTDFTKEFTQEDIQNYMKAQLDAQAKFSGNINLFDPDKNVMRKLQLIKLDPEVRKLGVLNISRAQFKDIDTSEMLNVDVTIENRDAQLNLQALRIRQVTKGEAAQ